MELTERKIKWIVFAMMFLTFPVLYFVLYSGGVLPLVSIAAMGFDNWAFGLVSFVHMVVYCPVFYFLSWAVSKRLGAVPERARTIRVAVLCGLLFGVTFLPVYLVPFSSPPNWGDAYYATGCGLHGAYTCN